MPPKKIEKVPQDLGAAAVKEKEIGEGLVELGKQKKERFKHEAEIKEKVSLVEIPPYYLMIILMILIGLGILIVLIYILKKLKTYSYIPKFTKGKNFEVRKKKHNYLKGIKNIYEDYKGNKQRYAAINKLKKQLNLLDEAKSLGVINKKYYGKISDSLKRETKRDIDKNIQNLKDSNADVNINVMEKLEKIQDKIKPSHEDIRADVYKMLEERGVDTGNYFIKEKNIPNISEISRASRISPVKIKKAPVQTDKKEMLKKIKEAYK